MPQTSVGIDAIAFSGPQSFVDMTDLAEARGIDPNKFLLGIGQSQMAVPTPCEDTVTMATQAARNAIDSFDIDVSEIGSLIVGTETGVDHSKPVAVYVHELLGLPTNCRTFETKHACFGGMAGLTTSADWIASGRAQGRKALVIASDIARYGLKTAGEPTQGAGAVAMIISEQPRLIKLNMGAIGDYTRQVMDFWRPLYSKYAFADGHYSIECYLEALAGSLDDARRQLDSDEALNAEHFTALLYHVPFTKMAKKAHRALVDWQNQNLHTELDFDDSYAQKVAPWLSLNARVGNIYTGSMFLSLIDFLRQLEATNKHKALSLFSYGSGCGACFCLGNIANDAHRWAKKLDPSKALKQRKRLSVEAYEHFMLEAERVDALHDVDIDPTQWGLSSGIHYLGTKDHQRIYGER